MFLRLPLLTSAVSSYSIGAIDIDDIKPTLQYIVYRMQYVQQRKYTIKDNNRGKRAEYAQWTEKELI